MSRNTVLSISHLSHTEIRNYSSFRSGEVRGWCDDRLCCYTNSLIQLLTSDCDCSENRDHGDGRDLEHAYEPLYAWGDSSFAAYLVHPS
jgi:hypothetical protein